MPVCMPLIRNLTGNTTLNVHYGTEAPADTSKLWVKRSTEAIGASIGVAGLAAVATIETLKAQLATGIATAASATVGTKIYILGGYGWNAALNTIQVFDTETETIETLGTTLPVAISGAAGAAVGTKVYVFGGYGGGDYQKAIQVFDTETGTLETHGTTIGTARSSMACAAVGANIYLFGGLPAGGNATSGIHVFDTVAGTYKSVGKSLPDRLQSACAAAVGTKIYVFGGQKGSYPPDTTDEIHVFDTAENTVKTSNTKLPTPTFGLAAVAVGATVYLFGGYDSSYAYLNTIHSLNAETETIEALDVTLPEAVANLSVGAVGINIYAFGGAASSKYRTIKHMKVFTRLDQDTAYLHASATENVFPLISGDYPVTLGVKAVYVGDADDAAEQQEAYLYDETTSEWKSI